MAQPTTFGSPLTGSTGSLPGSTDQLNFEKPKKISLSKAVKEGAETVQDATVSFLKYKLDVNIPYELKGDFDDQKEKKVFQAQVAQDLIHQNRFLLRKFS